MAHKISKTDEDAEDVIQDVWAKVHLKLSTVRNPASVKGWLIRVISSTAVDRARASRPTAGDVGALASDSLLDPEPAAVRSEEQRLAWQALATLTERQALAIYLREVEGYDYRRIAETLQTSVGSIEALLFRARRSLARSYLKLEGSIEERCKLARRVMATCIDVEGSPISRRALLMHCRDCRTCRQQMDLLRKGSQIHALVFPVLPQILLSQGASVSWLWPTKLLTWLLKAKASLLPIAAPPLGAVQSAAPILVSAAIGAVTLTALELPTAPSAQIQDAPEGISAPSVSDSMQAAEEDVDSGLIVQGPEGLDKSLIVQGSEGNDSIRQGGSSEGSQLSEVPSIAKKPLQAATTVAQPPGVNGPKASGSPLHLEDARPEVAVGWDQARGSDGEDETPAAPSSEGAILESANEVEPSVRLLPPPQELADTGVLGVEGALSTGEQLVTQEVPTEDNPRDLDDGLLQDTFDAISVAQPDIVPAPLEPDSSEGFEETVELHKIAEPKQTSGADKLTQLVQTEPALEEKFLTPVTVPIEQGQAVEVPLDLSP